MYLYRFNIVKILNTAAWRIFKVKSMCKHYLKLCKNMASPQLMSKNLKIVPILPAVAVINNDETDLDVDDVDIAENIAHLIILAKIALEKGDVDRAKAILDMGLKLAEERRLVFGASLIYDILVSIAINEGDIPRAEQLLVTVIERLIQDGSPEDNNQIVDFKLRLARIYSNHKRDPKLAEIGFKNCLDTQTRKLLSGDISTKTGLLYINVLFWYGIHNIRNDRYTAAKGYLDTAYDYSRKVKGLTPYQEMVILYTLADLNLELGELDVALCNVQTAVMLGKGISSSDLPRCYIKLATVYFKMGVLDQAASACREAVKLADLFNKVDDLNEANMLLSEINLAM